MCDVPFFDNSPPLDISKDLFEDFSNSNDDSTSIDDDSFSIDDIEYVKASPPGSELISLEVMEIVIPEVGGIDKDILLTIKDDILREKLLNINLLIANIEALKDNPTPSSDFMTKSSSTSLNFLLEETNTFDNSLPEFETFCFDSEENSSGSTTTHADISLLDYKAFYDDHVKEISSGSTNTHCDFSLYDSFIFDLSINLFPPADRSDFYEFIDELAHIISPLEYDCFSFKNETNSGDFTMDVFSVIHQLIREKTCAELLAEEQAANINTQPFQLHNDVQNIHEELEVYINTPSWDHPSICYNDDDDEDCTIAITPILSTEEPDNSLSMGDEHLDTIPETKSDEFIKSSVENLDFSDSDDDSTSIDDDSFSIDDIEYVEASPPTPMLISSEVMEIVIPEVGGIDEDILLTIKDDILHEKLLNINLLIANIEALKDNPTPSSDFMTKENSSGSTTTRADISLPDYEDFYDDHVKEISSGSTTTHFDFSLYDSFIFDLFINIFPLADRSDFYEFVNELAHIISPPEYDYNLTPSSKLLTKSSSTSPKYFLDETNTFHNSLPEFENFCFDLEEISSGSTTTHSDISLSKYEAFSFYDDHIEEISSGGTTTHSDISLSEYDLSDFTHEEFSDELAHIISPPEYDCFYFRNLPDPSELISILNSGIRENPPSTTRMNLPVEDDYSPLLTYVGRREKSLSSRKSHDTGASYVMVMVPP
nr:hypothetical protein [Tanacetum cinerariifolium]